jgi:hypothetical protein
MAHTERSIIGLFSDVVDETIRLFQTEVRLVRAEVSDKFGRLADSGIALGIGGVALLTALILLLFGIVRWLEIAGIRDEWGFLLVGAVVGAVGVGFLMKGVRDLKQANLVPERTIEQIKADFASVKEHVT